MKIERLDLKGFGRFNNFMIEFDEGFNVVYGENESGKTTIQSFIKAMFYSLKGGRNLREGLINPKKRYKPWDDTAYKGSIRYILDDGQCFTVERNFDNGEVRVYDSIYMDITKTFDQSKDKGPLFAMSHIGLTESCFEKTCFISQTGTRFSADESKDILDRLSNMSETGFEDVSFKSACAAIKEALRNFVGTEKTSTRPLDVINSKLSELKIRKQSLIKRREAQFFTEDEIISLTGIINSLIEEKSVLTLSMDIIKLREDLEEFKRSKKDLSEIAREISELNNNRRNIAESIDHYMKAKEQLGVFSGFEFEDASQLHVQYTKFEGLKDENGKILTEIQQLKQKATEIEAVLENLREFTTLTDIGIANPEYDNELKLESINNAELQKRIQASDNRNVAFTTGMAAVFVLMAGLVIYGITNENTIIAAIGPGLFLILFVILFYLKSNNKKLERTLKYNKKESDEKVKAIFDRVESQKNRQAEIFKMLNITSINEFLEKKVIFDGKIHELNLINEKIAQLEAVFDENTKLISELTGAIKEKMLVAKVISSPEEEVRREHIEKFQYELNRYKELIPYLNNREEMLADIDKRISSYYNRVHTLYGQKAISEDELAKILYEIDNKIKNLYKGIDVYAYRIKSIFGYTNMENLSYDNLMEIIMDLSTKAAREQTDELIQKVSDRMNKVQLLLKEKEMVLKELSEDSDELEQLEENIRELELKKGKLEDTGFSLRTALEVLEEANAEIKRDFAPLLNSNTSKIISEITSSRYGELRVDENLIPRTTEPVTGDIVPVSMLSGGTVDQMYLALRIALVQTIEKKSEKLPLIMDEVLAQYDDTRSLETLRMLKELSKDRQIILFTCKTKELELAKYVCNSKINVIELL